MTYSVEHNVKVSSVARAVGLWNVQTIDVRPTFMRCVLFDSIWLYSRFATDCENTIFILFVRQHTLKKFKNIKMRKLKFFF